NLSLSDTTLKERKKAMFEGVIATSLAIKNKHITLVNVNVIELLTLEEQQHYIQIFHNKILNLNKELTNKELHNSEILKGQTKNILKKFFKELLYKKPVIVVDLCYC